MGTAGLGDAVAQGTPGSGGWLWGQLGTRTLGCGHGVAVLAVGLWGTWGQCGGWDMVAEWLMGVLCAPDRPPQPERPILGADPRGVPAAARGGSPLLSPRLLAAAQLLPGQVTRVLQPPPW